MFGKFGDLAKLAKTAMEQSRKLGKIEVTGEADGGKVKVRLNGKMELINIYIDEELLEPRNQNKIRKLILKAHKDAMKKVQKELQKSFDKDELMRMFGG